MKQNLVKYYAEINEVSEEEAVKKEDPVMNFIKHNDEIRVLSFTYPITGMRGGKILFYNCNIGEVARVFSEDNQCFCYEHNEELKKFATYVNEKEDSSITWINSDEGLKNEKFNMIVYENGIDNLKQLEKMMQLLPEKSWLLTSGINDGEGFIKLIMKYKLGSYFYHMTKKEKIFLLNKP